MCITFLINLYLILFIFKFLYKIIYFFLYKLWNSFLYKKIKSFLIFDLNLFSNDWLIYGILDLNLKETKQLSFFKKYILSVYPDVYNYFYNWENKSISYLSNFREKNFPIFNEIVESNFFTYYKISLKDFNKFSNFLLKSKFSNKNFNYFMSKNFKDGKKTSVLYNLYNFLFFLETNFFFSLTYKHFFNLNDRIFVKFNILFLFALKKIKKNSFLKFYYLDNFHDFFSFNKDFFFLKKKTPIYKQQEILNKKIFFLSKFDYQLKYILKNVKTILKKNNKILIGDVVFLSDLFFNFIGISILNLKNSLKTLKMNFSESSTNKYIRLDSNFLKRSNFVFFFLRKNKVFNKSRYSRNRQTYRTGFYWCLWVNIFVIYGLYYLFFRFTFTFGYLWLPLSILFGSFLFGRALKYNFITFGFIFSEFLNFFNWIGFLTDNFYKFFINFFKNIVYFLENFYIISFFLKKYNYFFNNFLKFFKIIILHLKLNLNILEQKHILFYTSSNGIFF